MITEKSFTGSAVVLGAGTMGSGIAAQLANAGWSVRLLDIPGPDSDARSRNRAAQAGLDRLKTNRPPLLYTAELAARIRPGNTEDDLDCLASADWVIEAVSEKMEIKQALMAKIEARVGQHTLVSTNTSGLSLQGIAAGRGDAFRRRFFGSHFFNPPRYLHLVELITLPETDPAIVESFTRFSERVLGARVVRARDTPGFISNRIGSWILINDIHTALAWNLTPEETDYLTGPLIGRPRSATFRLADIVGFDIMADVARNQYALLPDDPFREQLILPEVVQRLIADGRLGEKTGAGFYRREGKEILALDCANYTYRPRREVKIDAVEALLKRPLPERLQALRSVEEPWAGFLNTILDAACAYARYAAPETTGDARSVDRVMMWGFNWQVGPLEISDLRRDPESNIPHYYSGTGKERAVRFFTPNALRKPEPEPDYLSLAELKAGGGAVLTTPVGSLVDLGEGVACLEFHTKMNTFDQDLTAFVRTARERAEKDFVAMVIGNQGAHFSAGYNVKLFLQAIAAEDWTGMDVQLKALQDAFLGLKYARIPVVGAPHGYTLGGGCECVLHCGAIQAAAELAIGLPETSIGVLPAGGGTKELLYRAMESAAPGADPFPQLEAAFQRIVATPPSGSAHEARRSGMLRVSDGISLNGGRLLYEARQRAIAMAQSDWQPPERHGVWALGEDGIARLRMPVHWSFRSGLLSAYDRLVADRVAYVLCGGYLPFAQEVSEQYLLDLEREAFIALAHEPKSAERMRHTLETGKPLRN